MTLKSYVRRGGRMSAAQERAYAELHARYCIPFSNTLCNFEAVFLNPNPTIIEIGFGMGSATVALAEANLHANYVGIEVFKAGVGKLLGEIERRGLQNVRVIEHDAAEVLAAMIGDSSVAAFYIFFPDPWPKKRHHKRRLLQRPFTALLAQKLMPAGRLHVVTDWAPYAEFALAELTATARLANAYTGYAPPQSWRPITKFEKKGLASGHQIYELSFIKVD